MKYRYRISMTQTGITHKIETVWYADSIADVFEEFAEDFDDATSIRIEREVSDEG